MLSAFRKIECKCLRDVHYVYIHNNHCTLHVCVNNQLGTYCKNDNDSAFDILSVVVTAIIHACVHRLYFPIACLYICADAITVARHVIINVIVLYKLA